jgi:GNAT superfamily N-acetyltransferase
MSLRVATLADIEAMHRVRMSVEENRLGDPSRVTPAHYREMLETRGRGWVYELAGEPDGGIVGFGIADHAARSIWALFVRPGHEGQGIGRALHDAMVDWLFELGDTPLWLTTGPDTRAARFYVTAGWTLEPVQEKGELRFVLDATRRARTGSSDPRVR